jgi:hypothetical protein
MGRGRFWALELDGEEEEVWEEAEEEAGIPAQEEGGSSGGGPTDAISLGSFIQRAEDLGGSLRLGRRAAFAPGGRRSRFGPAPPCRFHRLGDTGGFRRGGRSELGAERVGSPMVPTSPEVRGTRGEGSPGSAPVAAA